jgi:hypothetical protein
MLAAVAFLWFAGCLRVVLHRAEGDAATTGAAVLVGATGLVALRTRVLSRWLAWPSLLLAVAARPTDRLVPRRPGEPGRVDRAGGAAARPALDGGDRRGPSAREPGVLARG